MRWLRLWHLALCAAIVALDQATKFAVERTLTEESVVTVIPRFFNIILTYNRGAAFGMFSGVPDGTRQILLAVSTAVALAVVVVMMRSSFHHSRAIQAAFTAIIAGAVGNLFDRFRLGVVVDFLDFYVGSYHWPAFNVADSAICIGVMYLVVFGRAPTSDAAPARE